MTSKTKLIIMTIVVLMLLYVSITSDDSSFNLIIIAFFIKSIKDYIDTRAKEKK